MANYKNRKNHQVVEVAELGPFLGLILQWNVEEREGEWRAQMAAIRKTPMGPVTPVGRLDPATFAERALVNSEIAKVKRQKERARVQLPLPRGSWSGVEWRSEVM